jgi:hypothetical protein
MKKLLLLGLLPVVMLVACHKEITSINVDPKSPLTYPSRAFFTNAQKNMVNLLTSSNVNTNIFRLIVQYWNETTYTDEANFDLGTRQIPRQVWNGLYRDVLRDIKEAKKLFPNDVDPNSPSQLQNQLAIAEILEVYTWYYLVTTFGNVPYTEALDALNTQPVYDDQKTVYSDLLTRLDAAIASLNESGDSFGAADIVYGGDVTAWKIFANSFKLKMGMTIADDDAAKAKATVEAAVAAGVFTSSADNAEFHYLAGPPNTNPVWVDLVQSGRKDFVGTNTAINKLKAITDPRLPWYFTLDGTGADYSGATPGASSNYATFSKPSGPLLVPSSIGAITNPDFPAILMSYDEVEFFLAEAVERGYSVGGTAIEHYNNAITASILWWGGSAAEATAHLAKPAVNYLTATGTYKQKIGEQKWLALYNRGWESWIEWRRLDFPALVKPPTAQSEIPLRYTYTVPEQNLNKANYEAASAAIGGDLVTTKLFWDKN